MRKRLRVPQARTRGCSANIVAAANFPLAAANHTPRAAPWPGTAYGRSANSSTERLSTENTVDRNTVEAVLA